jgi:ATP-dependent DNA ligase
VFDILYYDGNSLIDFPLKHRLELLNTSIKNQNNHLRLLPRKELNTLDDIYNELDEAVKRQ